MITERLNSLLKVLIFAFLASGIALALLLQIQNYHRMQIYLATEATMPQHRPNGETRQYKNTTAGYSFIYPSKLSVSVSAGSVELHHRIPYKNFGECDMKGDEVLYDHLTDFRVNIFIAEGNIAQVVKQISPYMPKENFVNDTLTLSPGFIDYFEKGDLKGFSIYEGAEGCGHIIYYFPLNNKKVLVVKRNMVQQLSSAVTPEINQDVLVTPGVINPGQADLIFSQILKSFKYEPENINSFYWKTYRNEELGFEFKYPENLLIRDKIFEAECEVQRKLDCKLDIVNYDLGVDYIKNNNYPKEAYCDTITGEKCEKMSIGGEDLIVNWQWGVYIPVKNINNIFFEFKKTDKANKELLKQILSTFKFIDSTDTSSWKFYKNEKYGFEFKYPQEWSAPVLKDEVVELGCPKEDFEGELKCPLTFSILAPMPKTEFVKKLDLTPFKYGEKLINWDGPEIEDINLGAFEAISYRSVGMCNYTNSVYFGHKMNIHFQDNCEKYLNNGIYKQIANTFKFTK